MEHFIRVVMEKQDTLAEGLNEDVFPGSEVMETEQGATVFNIPLPRSLDENEADAFADKLVEYMNERGYEDYDIECSMDEQFMNKWRFQSEDSSSFNSTNCAKASKLLCQNC